MEQMYFIVLLLTILITSQANACIAGVIRESVRLPCIYNGVKNLTTLLISSEWRRNMEVIHTRDWTEEREDMQTVSHSIRTTVSSSAVNTGDFTMELRDIHISDAQNYTFYLKLHGQVNSSLICTVCLTVAGHFSRPTLTRGKMASGDETQLVCNIKGGYPAPIIYWFLNYTQCPQETSITTYKNTLPQSELYNITSVLSVNISPDTAVSCLIENYVLNETLTATNYGVKSSADDGRRSRFLWMVTTILCMVAFLLVAASLGLQMKLDRDRKKHHRHGDYSSCSDETETIVMAMEQWASLLETNV